MNIHSRTGGQNISKFSQLSKVDVVGQKSNVKQTLGCRALKLIKEELMNLGEFKEDMIQSLWHYAKQAM